jgi:hypothetical protein
MATDIDICNRALTKAGADVISSFDDETGEGTAAAQEYEGMLRAALVAYPWRFACKQQKLTKLDDAPLSRFACAYQVPPDSLHMRAVVDSAGRAVRFELYEDRILTDYDGDIWADYTFRPETAKFPPLFINALVFDLAASFKQALADDQKVAQALRQEAQAIWWPKAQSADAQSRTARRIQTSRFITVRR